MYVMLVIDMDFSVYREIKLHSSVALSQEGDRAGEQTSAS